jgi:hypothetical protein
MLDQNASDRSNIRLLTDVHDSVHSVEYLSIPFTSARLWRHLIQT